MKTVLANLSVCLLLLFSCKKEKDKPVSSADVATKKYAVSFNISDFAQSTETMLAKGAKVLSKPDNHNVRALGDHITNLLYIAYDEAGNEAGRIRQYLPNSTGWTSYRYLYPDGNGYINYTEPFGSIKDSLPAGTYNVILLGSTYHFTINERYPYDPHFGEDRNPLERAYAGEVNGLVNSISRTEDSFIKKFTLVVGNENTQQNVALERITGKVEINILDAIPANADTFEFRFIGAADYISFKLGAADGYTDYDADEDLVNADPIKITAAQKGASNYQFSKYIFAREQTVKVELRCFDAGGNIIARKLISDIHVYKNKRTILKGRLFDTRPVAGFTVDVNSKWDCDSTVVSF